VLLQRSQFKGLDLQVHLVRPALPEYLHQFKEGKMKLVSMKTIKSNKDTVQSAPSEEKMSYPYGLELSLNKETLDKLGIKVDNIDINSKCTIEAIGKITSISKNINERQDNSHMSIQLTDVAIHCVQKSPKTLREVLGKVLKDL
jgi:hypothetical protein